MKKFIPSKTLRTRTADPRWWTPECTVAVKKKQRADKAMKTRRTGKALEIYKFYTRQAARTLRSACKAVRKRIRRKLIRGNMQDRQWWSTLKRVGGDGRASDIPTIVHNDGSEASTSKEKADVFGKFFASKCSLEGEGLHRRQIPKRAPTHKGQAQLHPLQGKGGPKALEKT